MRKQIIRYVARYTLLYSERRSALPWDSIRDILIQAQCGIIENNLFLKGWKITLYHHRDSAYPYFIARHKYRGSLRIDYIDYQQELALIK
ncbi:hypothetical protein BIY27_25395 [Gibbsiella quercinecans]|uniref:hypothetical protein n=1 Tax=Gibbsiella quercinecans TaxID=929813 RepID=UPI000EF20F9E|nr:hypothetical protein [Gibbsiella quercinecans]RLM02254.1 hypothetical protein BIY27_25395 [Gibbsiella quercinecans]